MRTLEHNTITRVVELLLIAETKLDNVYGDLKMFRNEVKTKKMTDQEIAEKLNEILTTLNEI